MSTQGMPTLSRRSLLFRAAVALLVLAEPTSVAPPLTLLNVSYHPTRELYNEINPAISRFWKAETGQVVTVNQSHSGSTSFVQRGIGDVLLTWENETYLALKVLATDGFQLTTPTTSSLAEPSVSVVDRTVDRRGTRTVATAYLNFLYSQRGQEIAARHSFRPRNQKVLQQFSERLAKIPLFTVDQMLGGWKNAQAKHFADGAIFEGMFRDR